MYSFISTDWYTISSVYQYRGGVSRGLVVRTPETTQADLVVGFVRLGYTTSAANSLNSAYSSVGEKR